MKKSAIFIAILFVIRPDNEITPDYAFVSWIGSGIIKINSFRPYSFFMFKESTHNYKL